MQDACEYQKFFFLGGRGRSGAETAAVASPLFTVSSDKLVNC